MELRRNELNRGAPLGVGRTRLAGILLVLCAAGPFSRANAPPEVSNVSAALRPGAEPKVDIVYDLSDPDGDWCTVRIEVSADGGESWTVPVATLSGDVGEQVVPGAGRVITWDYTADLSTPGGADFKARVCAADRVGVGLTIAATSALGHAGMEIPSDAFAHDPFWGEFVYVADDPIILTDGATTIGTLRGLQLSIIDNPDFGAEIYLSFGVEAGAALTHFEIRPWRVPLVPIPAANAAARMTYALVLTENPGDSDTFAQAAAPVPGDGLIRTWYNNWVLFGASIAALTAPGEGAEAQWTASIPGSGFADLGVAVDRIALEAAFSLTAHDRFNAVGTLLMDLPTASRSRDSWGSVWARPVVTMDDDCAESPPFSLNDCNENGLADEEEIAAGQAADCNGNEVPDECDVADGASADANGNGVPDECEIDSDGDGVVDAADVCGDTPASVAVDAAGRPMGDLDLDCDTDIDDLALFEQAMGGPLGVMATPRMLISRNEETLSDIDGDGDTDLGDYALCQPGITGVLSVRGECGMQTSE